MVWRAEGGSTSNGVIFSFNPANLLYRELKDFDGINGREPEGSFMQASDKKLYAVTTDGGIGIYGVIFSYDINTSSYLKLHDFPTNYSGNSSFGALVTNQKTKLYGMTSAGGSYGAGTIFSYDANTAVYTKLKDFDLTNGGDPTGRLVLTNNGKLYGMTNYGGANYVGVIFSYDTATSVYTKLFDFANNAKCNGSGFIQAADGKLYGTTFNTIFSYNLNTSTYKTLAVFNNADGSECRGTLVQASDGKLYGMTESGGTNYEGVIFSFDPVTSVYRKLFDFNGDNGSSPFGSLIQASDGKLYGMTHLGCTNNEGVIFSFNPATLVYTKLLDFNGYNGSTPLGSLMQASDGKLYGMTSLGGYNNYGVAFSYDITTSTYTKLNDFTGNNGGDPQYTSFTELPTSSGIQISINDKSITEGNEGKKILLVPVVLNVKWHDSTILVHYYTQNITAVAGSDYIAQSGTLAFPPNIKKILLPIRIIGDKIPEADETFEVILNNSVNAGIADSVGVFTILNDDALTNMASEATTKTTSISLSPNPAKDKIQILLSGYEGNVLIQLSNNDGQILQQIKLQASSAKLMQQQISINNYVNGFYLITAVDEKGNLQTKQLIINR